MPNPLLKAGPTPNSDQVAWGFCQSGLENLQGQRLQNLPGPLLQCLVIPVVIFLIFILAYFFMTTLFLVLLLREKQRACLHLLADLLVDIGRRLSLFSQDMCIDSLPVLCPMARLGEGDQYLSYTGSPNTRHNIPDAA